jgi:transcription termination factor Rho
VSWFRSSQRRTDEPGSGDDRPPARSADVEESTEAEGLKPLEAGPGDPEPGAADREPERETRRQPPSNAPLDFFSLDPLEDDWEEPEDEEDEDDDVPAAPAAGRRRTRQRAPRSGAPAASGLEQRSLAELHALARDAGIERYRLLRRPDLVARLREAGAGEPAPTPDAPAPARRDSSRERGGRRRGGRGRGGRERRPDDDGGRPSSRERGRDARPSRDRDAQRSTRPPRGRDAEREEEAADEPVELQPTEGLLELMSDGFGFLRVAAPVRSELDPHVPRELVERFRLRAGDRVAGAARAARRSERNPSLMEVTQVNGSAATEDGPRADAFADLLALPPSTRLEMAASGPGLRMLELVTPLPRGGRALVQGPGGAGATTLLREIARGLGDGPAQVIVAVVDARPEELGEWRSVGGELFATSAEHAPADQVRGATLAAERAKRLVEDGGDVVLIVDSLTRLGRAHAQAGGRREAADSEGASVHEVKRLFAAARSTDGGSLTIIAAARSDGDAALDAQLREALTQIANVELHLDAELADAGLYPAIDVTTSRTRGEDALLDPDRRARLDALRGPARALEGAEAWRFLAERVHESGSNEELLSD